MINHIIYRPGDTLSPFPSEGRLYDIIFAANGVFIRSERPGLSVLGCIGRFRTPIAGLASLKPALQVKKIPVHVYREIIREAVYCLPNEALFYGRLDKNGDWSIHSPEQIASTLNVEPTGSGLDDCENAILELHSHGELGAFFSEEDDLEEKQGFRLYVVIGKVSDNTCEVKVRAGVFGHFCYFNWGDILEFPILPILNLPIMGTVQA